jgi:hypothetical protein
MQSARPPQGPQREMKIMINSLYIDYYVYCSYAKNGNHKTIILHLICWAALGFELRALELLGKLCTLQPCLRPFLVLSYFSDAVL